MVRQQALEPPTPNDAKPSDENTAISDEKAAISDEKAATICVLIGVAIAVVGFLLINKGASGSGNPILNGEICWNRTCIPYRYLLIVATGFWLWAAYLKYVRGKE